LRILKKVVEDGSFVKNVSLNSQLSPKLASQISIGAQASTGDGRVPQESLAFSSWNVGATDRMILVLNFYLHKINQMRKKR
jgi:hypothetical protein